jgi:hypothetical protein
MSAWPGLTGHAAGASDVVLEPSKGEATFLPSVTCNVSHPCLTMSSLSPARLEGRHLCSRS